MDYSIKKQEEEKTITIVLKGSLDSLTAPEIEDEVLPQLEDSEFEAVFIECKELDYMASSGLRLFFNVLKCARGCGARVVLRDVNDFVRQILGATGLTPMFEFE